MSPAAITVLLLNCGLALLVGSILAVNFTVSEFQRYPATIVSFFLAFLLPVLNAVYILAHPHNRLAGLRVLRLWRHWLDAKEQELLEKSSVQIHPPGSASQPPHDDRTRSQ